MAAKIEIAMKKSEPMTWARLDLPAPVSAPIESKTSNGNESDGADEWWGSLWKTFLHCSHTVHSWPLLEVWLCCHFCHVTIAVLPIWFLPLLGCSGCFFFFSCSFLSGHWLIKFNSIFFFPPHCLSQEPYDTRGPLALWSTCLQQHLEPSQVWVTRLIGAALMMSLATITSCSRVWTKIIIPFGNCFIALFLSQQVLTFLMSILPVEMRKPKPQRCAHLFE